MLSFLCPIVELLKRQIILKACIFIWVTNLGQNICFKMKYNLTMPVFQMTIWFWLTCNLFSLDTINVIAVWKLTQKRKCNLNDHSAWNRLLRNECSQLIRFYHHIATWMHSSNSLTTQPQVNNFTITQLWIFITKLSIVF